jgi:uncharacterized protein (TIGR03382 family)
MQRRSVAVGLVLALGVWLVPAGARASCAFPEFCMCNATGTSVMEAHVEDGGLLLDGGVLYAVDAVFGAQPDGGSPRELVLRANLPGRLLITDGNPQRVVGLRVDGSPDCRGSAVSHDAAIHAMLDGANCPHDVAPDFDGQCHDTRNAFGCSAAPDGVSGQMVLLGLALALRLRSATRTTGHG